jgi:hypothetical protein
MESLRRLLYLFGYCTVHWASGMQGAYLITRNPGILPRVQTVVRSDARSFSAVAPQMKTTATCCVSRSSQDLPAQPAAVIKTWNESFRFVALKGRWISAIDRVKRRRQLKHRIGANGGPCADSPSAATLRQTSGQK